MKELIKFCMIQHEEDVRKLAETPLGGQRFELLIRRYEMNNEPPPTESESDKYVSANQATRKPADVYFSGLRIRALGQTKPVLLRQRKKVTLTQMMTKTMAFYPLYLNKLVPALWDH